MSFDNVSSVKEGKECGFIDRMSGGYVTPPQALTKVDIVFVLKEVSPFEGLRGREFDCDLTM